MLNTMSLLITGLLLRAVIMFLIWKLSNKQRHIVVNEDSHTEGHFNELYNFEETKKLFGFIPSTVILLDHII